VARAGVHMGMVSPKCLLDEVFNDRHVIATFDMPNHLSVLAEHYPDVLGLTVNRLVYEHTLFPIYAPFTTEARRKRCLSWFSSKVRKSIHLLLGVVASRVRPDMFIRYCPECLKLMGDELGEFYWDRRWQVVGADCCILHGNLVSSSLERHSYHRHQFVASSPALCPPSVQQASTPLAKIVTSRVNELLSRKATVSAGFESWSIYYNRLAHMYGCGRGSHVNYGCIQERVRSHWSDQWLNSHGLQVDDSQSCWLRTIFRKHRKSFSYLEHIVVLESFLPAGWNMNGVLAEVSQVNSDYKDNVCKKMPSLTGAGQLEAYRAKWLQLVQKNGTKYSRINGGGAVYAWLYRHDKSWLLKMNGKYAVCTRRGTRTRVDWHARDIAVTRELIRIRNRFQQIPDAPRRSRNWYLSNFYNPTTLEKNLARMPVMKLFFAKNSESIPSYQIRRLEYAISRLNNDGDTVCRWRVLRLSGLSEQRLTREARCALEHLLK